MSIPPSAPPPGGYGAGPYGQGYHPAPPPPRKSGINGWKIAGFGCLGLFLLAAVGLFLLVRNVKEQVNHPNRGTLIGVAILAGKASIDGRKIALAVQNYHQKTGKYPQTLSELVEQNAIDGKLLHNDLDEDPNPGHISWRYRAPAEGASGSTPILEEPYQVTVSNQTQPGKIIINLDGTSQSDSSSRRTRSPNSETP